MKPQHVVVQPGSHCARPPPLQIHPCTSSSISSTQSVQLGRHYVASLSHHTNASCCAIHIVFNLAPKLSRHECKMAVKNNFFSHLHDYFLPPIYRLSSLIHSHLDNTPWLLVICCVYSYLNLHKSRLPEK